eukprot:NODE_11726_length_1268_cov_9.448729.p1 GENE.NODE_11726_length_1268_cov_9.448729~~NODE_11726_length_1268_cov_9.448729.p1  ORF type:complete len:333 (-),score=97.56 NODE_11726_length_1268_cov_9.448729:270-1184(-)
MSDGEFDDLLMGLARGHNNVEELMISILSFFERRTDLFHVMEHPDEKMGFAPGHSEKMLMNLFDHFQKLHLGPDEAEPEPGPVADAKAASRESGESVKKMSRISTWNGATTEKYDWTQSIYELTLEVALAESTTAKDLEVDISATRLAVRCKGQEVLSGKLHEKINTEECVWHLDGNKLVITFDKLRQTWWKCVLEGDEEIDTSKVESTRTMDEYDGETQGAIRKIMFDQSQKAKGQPTSDQIRTADVMRDAWNTPGSPFYGTDYDPSLLNLSGPVPDDFFQEIEKRKLTEAREHMDKDGTSSS